MPQYVKSWIPNNFSENPKNEVDRPKGKKVKSKENSKILFCANQKNSWFKWNSLKKIKYKC